MITPRPRVRLADVDAYGQVMNQYTGQSGIDAAVPDRPWAVHLTDRDHRFRLLCFDLDAKSVDAEAMAARDANVISGLLSDAGLHPVICQSGPSGGRHVWCALAESVDPETVATLGRLTRHLCPTLDLSPLSNPVTGCVRPPGAPHRAGGTSTIVSGDLNSLLAPTGTAAAVRALVEHLAALVGAAEPIGPIEANRPLPLDNHGHPYLPGPRRELPAVSRAALEEDAVFGDASAVLWRVLIGAAAARWKHADIAALVPTSPGLEHLRSYRLSTGASTQRVPREPRDVAATLARQWAKAVTHVATTPRQIGEDPTFDARADAIAAHVRDVQNRADAAAGRWSHGRGPADRRVLDVLSVLALQALTPNLEADIRRIGLLAGIGRETARVALLRLAADGWITKVRDAEGSRGACWRLHPHRDIHSKDHNGRSQADPRPAGAGAAERLALLETITNRIRASVHDVFTLGSGLGHAAGNLYARATTTPRSLREFTQDIGTTRDHAARLLDRLTDTGLLTHSPTGWSRKASDPRPAAAKRLRVHGRLAERGVRYKLERELWAWWQAEQAWMQAPRRTAASRRAGPGQLSLLPQDGTSVYGAHPRRSDGKADYREARRQINTGLAGSSSRRAATSKQAA